MSHVKNQQPGDIVNGGATCDARTHCSKMRKPIMACAPQLRNNMSQSWLAMVQLLPYGCQTSYWNMMREHQHWRPHLHARAHDRHAFGNAMGSRELKHCDQAVRDRTATYKTNHNKLQHAKNLPQLKRFMDLELLPLFDERACKTCPVECVHSIMLEHVAQRNEHPSHTGTHPKSACAPRVCPSAGELAIEQWT